MQEILRTLGISTEQFSGAKLVQVLSLVAGELVAVVVATFILTLLIKLIVQRLKAVATSDRIRDRLERFRRMSRTLLILLSVLLCIGLVGFNAWLLIKGVDPLTRTLELIKSVPPSFWQNLAWAIAKVAIAFYVARFVIRHATNLLEKANLKVASLGQIQANDESTSAFFRGLTNVFANALWMLLAVFAAKTLGLPAIVYSSLLKLATIYLIIGVGLIVVRTVTVIVESLDALSNKYAADKDWFTYYDALRPLVPLFRRCLEAAIWLVTATLVLRQLDSFSQLAVYGPKLIEAIWVFFVARVGIELGHLIIDNRLTDGTGLDELTLKRRATIAPLFKSIFTQMCYFIALVLILGTLGIDVMPFLAGAGILGVVIGLGAQPLINDVMSGFFILFENIFMVDDWVEIDGRAGLIEAIDFRTTRLRDAGGNLHIIRNGEMTTVKSFSKGYTHAVVDVPIGYENKVETIRALLDAAGVRLKIELPESVTGELELKGITEFGSSAMMFRTVVRVQPACHFIVANHLREIIKETFDAAGVRTPYEKRQIISNNPTTE